MIPEQRRCPNSFYERNLASLILLANDLWNIKQLLQDRGFPTTEISLDDGSRRFETLARITEGTVMGLVVGLKGPGTAVARKAESKKGKKINKHAQSMTLVHSQ